MLEITTARRLCARRRGNPRVSDRNRGAHPAVWQEFQSLLPLCPENRLERITPEGVRQSAVSFAVFGCDKAAMNRRSPKSPGNRAGTEI